MSNFNSIGNSSILASYAVSTATNISAALSSMTITKLNSYGVNVDEVKSEEEAEKILAEKEAEEVNESEEVEEQEEVSAEYLDLLSDAYDLAEDIGLSTVGSTDFATLMTNIRNRISSLESALGDNKNLKTILNEYNNRFLYIYEEYLGAKTTLLGQKISSFGYDGVEISAGLKSSK